MCLYTNDDENFTRKEEHITPGHRKTNFNPSSQISHLLLPIHTPHPLKNKIPYPPPYHQPTSPPYRDEGEDFLHVY